MFDPGPRFLRAHLPPSQHRIAQISDPWRSGLAQKLLAFELRNAALNTQEIDVRNREDVWGGIRCFFSS